MSDPVIIVPPSNPPVIVTPPGGGTSSTNVVVGATGIGPQGLTGIPGVVASSASPDPNSAVYWADTTEPGYEAVPPGGAVGQVLRKKTSADYDYNWSNLGSGTVTSITATYPLNGGTITSSGSIGIQDASTTQKGAVQLEDSVNSTSTTTSATPNSVKTAYDLASTATTAAGTAQATANSAVTLANTAQATANSAVTAAGNAQSTANSAVTLANTAQATANSAVTLANTAQATANSAVTAAGNAQSTADSKIASVSAGAGMTATTVAGAVTVTNAGVTSFNSTTGSVTLTSGTGIVVTNVSGTTTVTNDGVTSLNAGTGVSVSATKGGVTLTNTGILSVGAGTGLTSATVSGAVTLTNSGLLSLAGVTGAATVATSKGAVVTTSGSQITFSNTQDIQTSASPQFSKLGIGAAAVGETTAVNITGGRLALGVSSTNYASINIPVSTTVPTSGSYVIGDLWVGGSPATLAFATDINIAKAVAWADFSNATGVLGVANGGTGKSTWATNSIAVFNGTTATAVANVATSGLPLLSSASGLSVPSFSALDLSQSNVTVSGNLSISNGGTNASSAAAALTNLSGASLIASNAFTVGGHTITSTSGIIPLSITQVSSSGVDILQMFAGSVKAVWYDQYGRLRIGGSVTSLNPSTATIQAFASNETPLSLKAVSTAQYADLTQYLTSTNAVLGGVNAVGQTYSGSTTPITTQVGGVPTATIYGVGAAGSPTATTFQITLTSAPNLAVGDLITVVGIGFTGLTPNGTFVVTGVSNSGTFYVQYNLASTPGTISTLSTATVSAPAQASITARSTGTAALISRGNTQLGGTSGTPSFGGGSGVIGISNAATVPSSAPTGGGILYVTGGALTYRSTSGAARQIVNSAGQLDVSGATITGTVGTANGGTSATTAANALNILDSGAGLSTYTTATTIGTDPAIKNIICNAATPITLTFPAATAGKEYRILNLGSSSVISASANIIPRTGGAATTAILPATTGAWATLISNGTNYQIMASS